jgi:hypothetical protein
MGKRRNADCATLAVFAHHETDTLASWSADDAMATGHTALASEIEELTEAFAEDSNAASVRFHLRWLDKDGKVVVATTWRVGEAGELDGSEESRASQAQRHVEAYAKLMVLSQKGATDTMRIALDAANELIRTLLERIKTLELELDVAKGEADEARAKAAERKPKEPSAMEQVFTTMLEQGAVKMFAPDADGDGAQPRENVNE